MPPFAGQGLNAGLRDAASAAWKVAEAVNGTGTDALVDTYEAERRPHVTEMVRLSHLIGQVVMSTRPRLNRLRDAALDAVGVIPSLKRWLTGMRFLKQPRYVDGCAVPPPPELKAAAAELWGWSLAQPTVTLSGGERVPLDTVLGTGWALLLPYANGELEVVAQSGGSVRVTDPTQSFVAAAGAVLVVRPDRYVAALATPAGLSGTLRALATYSCAPQRLLSAADRFRTEP
jgi:3-(3-hydroxy-phenyl)propionate hydroxylase